MASVMGRTNKGLFGWVAVFAAGFVIGYGLMSLAVEVPPPAPPADDQSPVATQAVTPEQAPVAAAPASPVVADTAPEAPPKAAPVDAKPATAPPVDLVKADEPPPAPPKPATWWDKCRGTTCAVDFGLLTGGLSLRRAHLLHGTTIDWEKDYAATERIGLLKVSRNQLVEVKGVALDAQGQPAAAEISFTEAGKKMSGVISLRPGDKTIRFVPSEP